MAHVSQTEFGHVQQRISIHKVRQVCLSQNKPRMTSVSICKTKQTRLSALNPKKQWKTVGHSHQATVVIGPASLLEHIDSLSEHKNLAGADRPKKMLNGF